MTLATIWLWLPLLLCVGYFIVTYNRLIATRNACANARSSIDVNLKRRHQLIPNLVETVRGYAEHEQQALHIVTQARNSAITQLGTAASAAAEEMVEQTLTHLVARVEAYPELKASDIFSKLMRNLTEAEEQISASRRAFNGQVMRMNNLIQQFPTLIVANVMQFTPLAPYVANATAHATPNVVLAAPANSDG
ncbi:MAG: LemA family protein [Pseudomonadales bacterium]